MKQKINQRKEELQKKEKKILLELESSEKDLREKAKSVGKIALISGLVALFFYWVFKAFLSSDDKIAKKKKKKGKKTNWNIRIGQLVTPYLVKFLSEILELEKIGKNQDQDAN